jgi:glutathione S-transferase
MKLYDNPRAPNTRRVRIFLAEKGISIDSDLVDLVAADNLKPAFKKMNPCGRVPVLALDDGSYLSESVAICRYFEETQPEPALFGSGALERATVEMWNRRVEHNVLGPVAHYFRHTTGFFADREQLVKEWGEINEPLAQAGFDLLEQRLTEADYLAGDHFSIADITALCTLDFAAFVGLEPFNNRPQLTGWHQRLSSRPSATA